MIHSLFWGIILFLAILTAAAVAVAGWVVVVAIF